MWYIFQRKTNGARFKVFKRSSNFCKLGLTQCNFIKPKQMDRTDVHQIKAQLRLRRRRDVIFFCLGLIHEALRSFDTGHKNTAPYFG